MIAIKMSKSIDIPMESITATVFGELVVHNNDGYEIFRCKIKDYQMSASRPYQRLMNVLNNNVTAIEHSDRTEVNINVTASYTIFNYTNSSIADLIFLLTSYIGERL